MKALSLFLLALAAGGPAYAHDEEATVRVIPLDNLMDEGRCMEGLLELNLKLRPRYDGDAGPVERVVPLTVEGKKVDAILILREREPDAREDEERDAWQRWLGRMPGAQRALPGPQAPGRSVGTLTLNQIPRVGVKHNGKGVDLCRTGQRVEIFGLRGTLVIGDVAAPLALTLTYEGVGGEMIFRADSERWAIVSVNGVSRGSVPAQNISVTSAGLTKAAFKRPPDQQMTVRMRFNPE